MITEEQLAAKVHEFLQNSDLKKTTNNIVIKKLEDDFGVDLSDRKPFLRYQVGLFLQSQYEFSEEFDDGGEVNREEKEDDDEDENDDVSDDDSGGNDDNDDGLYDKVPEVKNVVKIIDNENCKLEESDNLERPIQQSDKYGDVRLGGLSVPEVSAVVKTNNNGNSKLQGTDKLERPIQQSDEYGDVRLGGLSVPEVSAVVKINNNGDCKLNEMDTLEWPIQQSDKYGDVRLGGLSVPEWSAVVSINNDGNCKLKGTDKLERGLSNSWTIPPVVCAVYGAQRPRKKKEKIKRTCFAGKYCTLSPELQKFLGVPHMTRTEVIKQLWTYVKEKSLQDPNDGKTIICDETLRDLLGVDSINILQIHKALTKHIIPSAQKHKRKGDPCGDESNEKRQKQVASVFFPPLPLSDTLKRFLGTEETALTRGDVVKRIWDYIKLKNLKDPSDKKTIICDEKLKELVNVDTFNGFTVTKLLSPHFMKFDRRHSASIGANF